MGKFYRYPLKTFTDKTDYLQIDVVRYTPIGKIAGQESITLTESIQYENPNIKRDPDNNIIGNELGSSFRNNFNYTKLTNAPKAGARRNTKKALETVLLPIPGNLQDGTTVNYGASSLNSIAGAAVGTIADVMKKSPDIKNVADLSNMGGTAARSFMDQSGLDGGAAIDLVTKTLASQAAGILGANVSVDQFLAREQGVIFNPNMEMLFNGPTLRQFGFQFQLTPRNKEESLQIKQIIRCFKKNMSPKVKNDGRLFLNTPNVFELRYRQGSREHSFLNKFKQCFLTDIKLNYTGTGNYATYDDGTPVSTIMSLSFQELEPVYDIDYDDISAGTGVGY